MTEFPQKKCGFKWWPRFPDSKLLTTWCGVPKRQNICCKTRNHSRFGTVMWDTRAISNAWLRGRQLPTTSEGLIGTKWLPKRIHLNVNEKCTHLRCSYQFHNPLWKEIRILEHKFWMSPFFPKMFWRCKKVLLSDYTYLFQFSLALRVFHQFHN